MTEAEIKQTLVSALVTVTDVADILKVSTVTVYRWVDEGTLEGIKVTGPGHSRSTYRVKSASVRRLLGVDEYEVPKQTLQTIP